jgi:hypothetical protein
MKLVRDVLDKELLDCEGEPMGRVDGLVMHAGKSSQPRITHIEIGGGAPWERVHPAFARLAKELARLWGPKRQKQVRGERDRRYRLGDMARAPRYRAYSRQRR